ncbi:hypothetical protein H6504_02795 [Candidatus Woesearchaeota archaeon]|nr:hypothetical protein [Candidatus Woesearchaeota archaeon]
MTKVTGQQWQQDVKLYAGNTLYTFGNGEFNFSGWVEPQDHSMLIGHYPTDLPQSGSLIGHVIDYLHSHGFQQIEKNQTDHAAFWEAQGFYNCLDGGEPLYLRRI